MLIYYSSAQNTFCAEDFCSIIIERVIKAHRCPIVVAKPTDTLSYTKGILRVYKKQVISSAQLSARENFFLKNTTSGKRLIISLPAYILVNNYATFALGLLMYS